MKYTVNGVTVALTEDEILVAGSVKVHYAEFVLDESWEGYAKTVVFKNGNVAVEKVLVDNKCEIPWEALKSAGILFVGIRGEFGDKQRPTLWAPHKAVHEGTGKGAVSREPTPDMYAQLLNEIAKIQPGRTPELQCVGKTIYWKYEYEGDNMWIPLVTVKDGEDGAPGEQGPQGVPGPKGDTGDAGAQGPQGVKGDTGAKGADGQTPFIGGNGNWWIGTTDTGVKAQGAVGATGAQGPKGDKGDTGERGADGQDGAQGAQGPKGDKGDTGADGKDGENGADGAPGHTPVKGVDYYTEEDKAEMVDAVLAALPNGDEVAY